MRHLLPLSLAVTLIATVASARMPGAPPAMKVAQPAGFAEFYPASLPARCLRDISGQDALTPPRDVLPAHPGLDESAPLRHQAPAADSRRLWAYLSATNVENLEPAMYSLDLDGNTKFLWKDYLTAWGWNITTGWLRDNAFSGLAGVKLDGYFMGYALVELSLSDGEMLNIDYINLEEEGMQSVFVSSAYRVMDDKVYGYSYTEEGEGLAFSVARADDFHNVRLVRNVDLDEACASMTYDPLTDTMYGVNTSGQFVTVAPDGTQTVLYELSRQIPNLMPSVASGMGWFPSEGYCVYDAYLADNTTALYALDPKAKSPVLLSECDRGATVYSAMFSTASAAQPEAPAQATFRAYDFAGISLSGSLTWSLPSVRVDGSALTGTVDYTLYIDGEPHASGTSASGSEVVVPVNNTSNGQHTFAIVCEAAGYRGEPAVYRHWVGPDAPLAPAGVTLTETLVSWEIPVASEHGGYVDYSDITYSVYLNGRKLADTKDLSLAYTLPEGEPFTSYTAEVQATFKGWSSPRAASNFIQYGQPLEMPLHFRPLEKELELMTLINVDGHVYDDGTQDTWRFTTEMGFPSFASGYDGDDWMILPPMMFTDTEMAYRYEMEIGLVSDTDTSGTFEVCLGTAPTAEAMTRVIIPESRCLHMLGDILEEFFAVPEPGVYYIGIHVKTGKTSFHVSDIDVSLSDRSADVPVGVTGLEATAAPEGALSATVSFTMPTVTAADTPLPADVELTAVVGSFSTKPGYDQERTPVAEKTVTALPGARVTMEIETAQNYNAIVVAIRDASGLTGKGEETLIYTGVDLPYLVTDLKSEVSEDNMTMTLTWKAPTEGENDGPIGDSFLYVIYDYLSSSWQFLEEAGWDVYEYSYTVPDNWELGYMTLGVMAYNAAGLSYHIAGQSASLGHPVEIPWTNDLDNDVTDNNAVLVRPTEQYYDTYWLPGDPASLVSPIFALDSNFAFIGYTLDAVDRKTRLALPKVSTAGQADVTLTFDYWGGRYAARMRLLGQGYGMEAPVVICELPREADGWTSHTVTLPADLQDCGWMILFVEADLPDDQSFAMFSGYTFEATSGAEGIPAVGSAILGGKGTLAVSGHAGDALSVTDLDGRLVLHRDRLGDRSVFALAPGLYVVRAGSDTAKVIVR
ncbi:MAG: fibronectin type III domain-containing protein [Muribaculaceae bacterium]|nr:fibronectin type III domain-containing protein [Muribaculaceae bacterium]